MTEALIRVAILDDHEYIVHSLERLLDEEPDLEVVVASTDAEDFLDRVSRTRPNIAVVDLLLHGNLLGHRVVEELTRAGVLCLAFTADQRPVPVRLAMRAGARGLVLKADPIDQLATAIRAVRETGWAPSSATATTVLANAAHVPDLSGQELACLRQAARGVPVKSIGKNLDPPISASTVRTYLNRAHSRYAEAGYPIENTVEVLLTVQREGWFDVGPGGAT